MTADEIIRIIFGILGVLVTSVLVPYLKKKLDITKLDEVKEWINEAVYAAEETFKDPKAGAKKKEYVVAFLNDKGVKIDDQTIDLLIQSAVKLMRTMLEGE